MTAVLYHNPKCSKSRELHGQLEDRGVAFETVEYLGAPLGREELLRLIEQLPGPAADLVRKDKKFKELGLVEGDYVSPDAIADLLVAHPELMQRPILVVADRAAIGRPAEHALALL